mmetsp:Transcript_21066/g.62787  ORF Transcript_21066/g.62787 Transcript_21066/m.62787 type:complete len:240 (-) Transcript_21066:221-940(-)
MAEAAPQLPDGLPAAEENVIKIILLGDSAVGKSKLVERFLMNEYQPRQLSTFALTLFRHVGVVGGKQYQVDFWDTAGQERFNSMHPAYYHMAHACIMCFDVTRKQTYKNLPAWYKELREYRPGIPVICVANKIDVDAKVTQKEFAFPKKHNMTLFYCSASDGTNVSAPSSSMRPTQTPETTLALLSPSPALTQRAGLEQVALWASSRSFPVSRSCWRSTRLSSSPLSTALRRQRTSWIR